MAMRWLVPWLAFLAAAGALADARLDQALRSPRPVGRGRSLRRDRWKLTCFFSLSLRRVVDRAFAIEATSCTIASRMELRRYFHPSARPDSS
jgi:hypothetical protein